MGTNSTDNNIEVIQQTHISHQVVTTLPLDSGISHTSCKACHKC